MLPSSAAEHYATQQRLQLATIALTRREWANMGADFDASWATIGPRISLLTASAQLGAARNGAAYIPNVLAELGQSVDPLGEVNPSAFAGIASDGRPLDSLLYGAVTTAKTTQSLDAGGKWLDMAVQTMVADAARGAAGIGIAARPGIGWERMVNPPCCKRCAALAGRVYKWNAGFDRHPRCDCTHVPCGENAKPGLTNDPPLDQITGLSASDRKAIADGADRNQVINADRRVLDPVTGKYRKVNNGMTTTEGTTKRGLAGQRLGKGRQRLTPDGIYRIASDRTEAVTLLRQHGYLL